MMKRYEQIALDLQKIVDDKLKRNDIRFPTEAELGRQFQVSRVTIRKALAILEGKGLLVRRQGSGCFLTGRAPDSSGNQIALLLSSPFSYRSPGIVDGVRHIASREGFLLSVYDMRNSLQTERQILTDFLSSAPRGLILEDFSSIPDPNSDLLEQLTTQGSHVPVVSLFGSHDMEASAGFSSRPVISSVCENLSQGAEILARELTSRGHRKIAGLFPACTKPDTDRLHSWLLALRNADISLDADFLFLPGNLETEEILGGKSARLSAFLDTVSVRCTALVCSNDLLAAAAAQQLKKKGLHIPEDLCLASFEESYLQQLSPIHTASLRGCGCIGEQAANLLFRMIRGANAENLLLPLSFSDGESLGSVRDFSSPAHGTLSQSSPSSYETHN